MPPDLLVNSLFTAPIRSCDSKFPFAMLFIIQKSPIKPRPVVCNERPPSVTAVVPPLTHVIFALSVELVPLALSLAPFPLPDVEVAIVVEALPLAFSLVRSPLPCILVIIPVLFISADICSMAIPQFVTLRRWVHCMVCERRHGESTSGFPGWILD